MIKKIIFTKEGFEDLLKEKKELDDNRIGAVKELSIARDMGDRSENAFYKTARQKLSGIDRRLREINRLVRLAEVVKPNNTGVVEIGTHVVLQSDGETFRYLIVGDYESDLSKGRLSCTSPLGKSLIGKRSGETISLTLPKGEKTYTIESIN